MEVGALGEARDLSISYLDDRPRAVLALGDVGGGGVGRVEDHAADLPLRLTLGAPLLFGIGRSRVIARSVIASPALLAFHARVHELAGAGDDAPHTLPGAWTAHVTLARRVPLDRVGEALAVIGDAGGSEVTVTATGVRRWDAATRTVSDPLRRGTLEGC